MNENKISCKQVKSILPFYIKGAVNPFISDLIEEHLEECSHCKKYYLKLLDEYNKNYVPDIDNIEIDVSPTSNEKNTESYITNEYQIFKKKLSAYFDSELDNKEQIKMKKLTISNPLARKDFENMYRFKQLIHSSFEKTKNNLNIDFSKNIIKKLSNKPTFQSNFIPQLYLGIIVLTLTISFILYFRH